MNSVLVTGGAGFIGSHLCEALLAKGSKVVCIDNFVTGKEKNVEHLLPDKNFLLVEEDIVDAIDVEGKFSRVYNLASPASPADFPKIPVEILLANSLGTKNALDFAAKNKARLLEASTSEVYGQPLEHPQKETYFGNVNPVGPRACYDESKRFAEALVMAYGRKKFLDTRIARIFNTYGQRMRADDGRVIPNFITQALQKKPITVYGRGKQTRSFCFVTDLVEGLIKLMESDYSMPVNLGNPTEDTILHIAEEIKRLAGSESKIVFSGLPEDDPERRKPDISVAKKQLGWQPKISFEEGILKTIQFFKKEI